MTALLELDHVTHTYGGRPAVIDVCLTIEDADFIGIVGPSGSGKTTLLRMILGSIRPTSGTVHRRPNLKLAYVPQVETVNWQFPVTVHETVLMARTGRTLPWASRAERRLVSSLLERLGIGGLERRHIRELSCGQQQRVFIARALLREPDVLLLDEPSSGVDVRTRHELLHLLAELNEQGVSVLVTTHDLNGVAAHLPHLVCLNREIVGAGTPREVLTPVILERTYGAPMAVLEHAGMPIVVDHYTEADNVIRIRTGTES